MNKLNEYDIQFLVARLQKGETIPEDYKYKLFPVKQKEYELVYAGKMRKEDILANEDGVFSVPLQVEKVFNGEEYPSGDNDWWNMIVFGDNLQFLKTVYENKDPLIKDKVKGKVKLIYIDPPFGTGDEYDGNKGQRAYTARAKGAEFVEFLRRRIILAREILANDGVIAVRQAFNFGHYVKVIFDEVFGKENFINEIIIGRKREGAGTRNKLDVTNESIFVYSNSNEYTFNEVFSQRPISEIKWTSFLMAEERKPPERKFFGLTLNPPKGQHFSLVQEKCDKLLKANFLRLRCKHCGARFYYAESKEELEKKIRNKSQKFKFYDITSDTIYFGVTSLKRCLNCKSLDFTVDYLGSDDARINSNWFDIRSYSSTTNYPTENSEELLQRIIETFSIPGDLVLDFFAGSGTTAAVTEKLGRRWIVCDIGKLAFYTMQKRILTIENSKYPENPKKEYGKNARSFVTINTGLYNLKKIFELKKDDYINFVMNLFEVETIDKKVGGIKIDGQKKDGYYVLVYPYWQFRNASVDEEYLEDLHSHIGSKIGERLYIIAPANYVDFISDYHEIGKVRYYFLKVPYQIIKELHKVQFKKFRQPQSKRNVNDLDDAIGFHFIRQPDVESRFIKNGKNTELQITKFLSNYLEEDTGMDLGNFESLAMVLVDKDYNGKEFVMDEFYFAEDLLPKKKEEETEEEIKQELKQLKKIPISLNKQDCGDKIMIVYVDIYGNEFKEVLSIKK